jgi:hypothetical protein
MALAAAASITRQRGGERVNLRLAHELRAPN